MKSTLKRELKALETVKREDVKGITFITYNNVYNIHIVIRYKL